MHCQCRIALLKIVAILPVRGCIQPVQQTGLGEQEGTRAYRCSDVCAHSLHAYPIDNHFVAEHT